ncbi:Prefoldin [Thamnocephalis sphaerospora]|uniref:Prefoldin n=1 Tax=Thamnocephalis sphaerospora TaxID=78915 RepID=A0A4P9XJ12_9FUNG|nr:Prefoldin [Thamnocephalis sphaerospora]|eukprot:RKP05717.1 Prefoldin [Thamnocephalis sphaerospora]
MSSKQPERKLTPEELTRVYNTMKQELQQLAQKISELEMEKEEHTVVIETIEPLDKDRKCFRLVGGVLVERTVADVLPALKTNCDGINDVIEKLMEQHKKRDEEFQIFQKMYGIRAVAR